jgi:hypothetical protein
LVVELGKEKAQRLRLDERKKPPERVGQASGELVLSPGGKKISGRVREKWSGGLKARLIDDNWGIGCCLCCGRQVSCPRPCSMRKKTSHRAADRQTDNREFYEWEKKSWWGALGV